MRLYRCLPAATVAYPSLALGNCRAIHTQVLSCSAGKQSAFQRPLNSAITHSQHYSLHRTYQINGVHFAQSESSPIIIPSLDTLTQLITTTLEDTQALHQIKLAVEASITKISNIANLSVKSHPPSNKLHMGSDRYSVGIVGSGNWGTAIAKVIGENIERMYTEQASQPAMELAANRFMPNVLMYVHEEIVEGDHKLSELIRVKRENPKYLPGHHLPDCVQVTTNIADVGQQCNILFIVMPHQFVAVQCKQLKRFVRSDAFAVSLCKGFMHEQDSDEVCLISTFISKLLNIPCHVIMGASIANEVAAGKFCEATVGAKIAEHGQMIKELLQTRYYRVAVLKYAEIVEICGAVKNVVAVAAGFCDGLGFGDNTKAAVVRLGLIEMIRFAKLMFPCEDESVFMESCGVADLVATCYGGRNRRVAEAFVTQKKSMDVLEMEMLNGQKLQGPSTSKDIIRLIQKKATCADFPIFKAVYEICYEARPVNTILDALP